MKNTMKKPVNIPISKLRPFEGHPFKVKDDEEMNTLIESIQTVGILSNTEEYEVISGHRRLHAAQKAGITEVPALIYALDRDSAAIAVVDSNLHREHILPSEKAFAYKLKMEALSHQGTSRQLGEKWSVSQISESANESERQIHRYIRLTNLIPELLEFMDEGKMALSVGVELSFLDEQRQYDVLEQCEINDCTPSYSQAWRMHKADREGLLTKAVIQDIMCEEKANQREMFKIPMERIRQYVPNANVKQAEDFVLKACEHYRKYLRNRDRDSR